MISILIVDDELLLRSNLKLIMNWEQYGFTICGEASNGLEALRLLESKRPDIVLSDIRMPFMDGLQLSTVIYEKYPGIKMIMLSNYDDFEYVKGTLKNGAADYILKHRLNAEVLLESLLKVAAQVNKSSEKNNNASHLPALKTQFLIQLLTGYYNNEQEIHTHIQTLDLNIEMSKVIPIVLEVDDFHETMERRGLRGEAILQFALINIIEEVLSDHGNGVVSHISNERFVILLSFAGIRSDATVDQTVNAILTRIDLCLKKFVKITASFSIGMICSHIIQVPSSFESAVISLREKFFKGKNCMIKSNEYGESGESSVEKNLSFGLDIGVEKELIASIKLQNRKSVIEALENIFSHIKNKKLNLVSSQMIFNELLGIMNRMCKDNEIDVSFVYANGEIPHETLANMDTLPEIQGWMLGLFDRLLALLNTNMKMNYSNHIKKAVYYINQHFYQNISLVDVAAQIGISNSYLSSQFKEEVGVGFSEYLNELRLERAKALIIEGKMELKEVVSICGFNNYAYFFQVFKRRMGLTPKEYLHSLTK